MSKTGKGVRYAEVERETSETRVRVVIDLDGGTRQDVTTGIPFFDHLLQQMAFHGRFDLGVSAEGDLGVDDHHTVEDVGIVLGKAFREAMKGNESIARYGETTTPTDEALVSVIVDFSGRGHYYGELPFRRDRIGILATESIPEFLKAFALHAGVTLHIRRLASENDHHLAESTFKGLGRSIYDATRVEERRAAPSKKGVID